MSKPDFIIAGASRCGTTSLAKWLDKQEGIQMAQISPEPKFFSRIDLYLQGQEEYLKHWNIDRAELRGGKCGEKSTEYLECPEAPVRIKRTLRDPKIIFVLRNPVHRAYSNFLWSRKNGLEYEKAFHEAILREAGRNMMYRDEEPRWWTYVTRGFYAAQLVRWVGKFDIHFLFYPYFLQDPRETSHSLGRFLGKWLNPGIPFEQVNASWDQKMTGACFDFLKEVYKQPNVELADLIQDERPLRWNRESWSDMFPARPSRIPSVWDSCLPRDSKEIK